MNISLKQLKDIDLGEAVRRLKEAAEAKKCWGCGCLNGALDAIEAAFSMERRPPELDVVIKELRAKLIPQQYDCLGCDVCLPPLALNALNIESEACPSEEVESREGWPPLPGTYIVLRHGAPVAVCTLTDETLCDAVASAAGPEVSVVGSVHTENLGLERIIRNTLSNPNIRFLVLCGPDSRQAIGHLPGQSMLAFARSGLDERSRIIGAEGRRPLLKNISREAAEHFRKTVEVIDLVGHDDVSEVLAATRSCASRNPGPAEPFSGENVLSPIKGYIPDKMLPDPAGYFVVYPDRSRGRLSLEHYGNDGVLRHVIEGATAAELYIPAIEKGLISRLDHAAYLGRELARAERTLRDGTAYTQDAAPDHQSKTLQKPTGLASATSLCGCGASCGGKQS